MKNRIGDRNNQMGYESEPMDFKSDLLESKEVIKRQVDDVFTKYLEWKIQKNGDVPGKGE